MAITYEILALRYGILDGGRLQYQNYIIPDDHLAPDPLDFLVFAIRGNGRAIVMDTGFNPVSAARRGRELFQRIRRGAAVLLHEIIRDLAPRVIDQHGKSGLHEAGRHWPTHVTDSDEADGRFTFWHHRLP